MLYLYENDSNSTHVESVGDLDPSQREVLMIPDAAPRRALVGNPVLQSHTAEVAQEAINIANRNDIINAITERPPGLSSHFKDLLRLMGWYRKKERRYLGEPKRELAAGNQEVGSFVEQRSFQVFVAGAITINIVTIGLETDLGGAGGDASSLFNACNLIFLFLYIGELLARFFVQGLELLKSGLAVVDIITVTLSLAERLVSSSSRARSMVALRLVRVIAIARLSGKFNLPKELKMLLLGCQNISRSLGWASAVMLLVLLTAAPVCRDILGESAAFLDLHDATTGLPIFPYKEYFGSILNCIVSLMQLATMSQWTAWGRPVVDVYPAAALFLFFFCFITTYGIVSSIVASFVYSSITSTRVLDRAKEELEKENRQAMSAKVLNILLELDSDCDGHLSGEELNNALATENKAPPSVPATQALYDLLEELGLPLSLDGDELVKMLDVSGDGYVSYDELQEGLVSLNDPISAAFYLKLSLRLWCVSKRLDYVYDRADRLQGAINEVALKLRSSFHMIKFFTEHKEELQFWGDLKKYIRSGGRGGGINFSDLPPKEEELEENVAQAFLMFAKKQFAFVADGPPKRVRDRFGLPRRGLRGLLDTPAKQAFVQLPGAVPAPPREAWGEESLREAARGEEGGQTLELLAQIPMTLKHSKEESRRLGRKERDKYELDHPFDRVTKATSRRLHEQMKVNIA